MDTFFYMYELSWLVLKYIHSTQPEAVQIIIFQILQFKFRLNGFIIKNKS